MSIQDLLSLGFQQHQAGRLAEAEALYRQILAADPEQPDALHLLGAIAYQVGRPDVAVEWLRRAVLVKPNFAAAQYNLGNALRDLGEVDEAIAAYRRAIELQPGYADAHHNLGLALKMRNRWEEAVAAYRQAAELRPSHVETLTNLGNVLKELGRTDDALAAYRHALEINPHFAPAHYNLGNLLREQKQLGEAMAAYHRALELNPGHAEAHHNLGLALRERGDLAEAVVAYRRALALRPDYVEVHTNLGIALVEAGDFERAIGAHRRAIELRPDEAESYNNLGIALKEQGRFDEAIAAHRRAIELNPSLAEAHNNLGVALEERGELDEAIREFRRAQETGPALASVHSNLMFALHLDPGQDERAIAAEQERWNQRFGEPLRSSILPHSNDRDPERRLKIGYVSPDFRDHTAGSNLLPLFRCHDPRNFEILCYSGVVRPDAMTAEFQRFATEWRSTLDLTDEALAATIRRDGVDILVDLAQHTSGNRLPVFAHQPAPVQVSFLGYPDDTGLATIDYRISDPWLESEIEDRRSEIGKASSELRSTISHLRPAEQVFLIDSFWCYDPRETDVEINPLPARENGFVTFGSLNNFAKINPWVWKLWARVLGQVRHSRLAVLSAVGGHRNRVLELLQAEGIAPDRVEFFSRRPRRAYLELYHRLDVVLDPFPYNGHTTSLDALWMGVPVVSLAGATRVSRGGLSILNNLGVPELVARTPDEYVQIATELARDLARTAQLRATLRARMQSSVLTDAPRFARSIEAAYRAMWRQWCATGEKSAD